MRKEQVTISVERAISLDISQKYREALEAYQELVGALVEDSRVYVNLGALYSECNNPGFNDHYQMPQELKFGGGTGKALEVLTSGAARFPENGEVLFWLAYVHHRNGSAEIAEALIEKVLKRWPQLPYTHLVLPEMNAYASDFFLCWGHLKVAEALLPGVAGVLEDQVQVALTHRRFEEAKAALTSLLKLFAPENPQFKGENILYPEEGKTFAETH